MKTPPKTIQGVPVEQCGDISEFEIAGEQWITLIPADPTDGRVWEFGIRTGRIIQTMNDE